MKQLNKLIAGLTILASVGYENVTANDGVIFAGSAVDSDEEEKFLTELGFEWDEDNSEWYLLVQRDSRTTTVTSNACSRRRSIIPVAHNYCYHCGHSRQSHR